jgi:hypothetical protein
VSARGHVDWPFTPEVDSGDGGWQVSSDADGLRTVYVIEGDDYDLKAEWAPQDERIAANANLIAATPRMYRALKELLGLVTFSDQLGGHITLQVADPLYEEIKEIVRWIDSR